MVCCDLVEVAALAPGEVLPDGGDEGVVGVEAGQPEGGRDPLLPGRCNPRPRSTQVQVARATLVPAATSPSPRSSPGRR